MYLQDTTLWSLIMKFKWNLDTTVKYNGVSYTLILPPNTGYVFYKDPMTDINVIDNQVESMTEFPQVLEVLSKLA